MNFLKKMLGGPESASSSSTNIPPLGTANAAAGEGNLDESQHKSHHSGEDSGEQEREVATPASVVHQDGAGKESSDGQNKETRTGSLVDCEKGAEEEAAANEAVVDAVPLDLDGNDDAELAAMDDQSWRSVREQEQQEIASTHRQDDGSRKADSNFLMTAAQADADNVNAEDDAGGTPQSIPSNTHRAHNRGQNNIVDLLLPSPAHGSYVGTNVSAVSGSQRRGGHSVVDPQNVRANNYNAKHGNREGDASVCDSVNRSTASTQGGHRVLSYEEANRLMQKTSEHSHVAAGRSPSLAANVAISPSARGQGNRAVAADKGTPYPPARFSEPSPAFAPAAATAIPPTRKAAMSLSPSVARDESLLVASNVSVGHHVMSKAQADQAIVSPGKRSSHYSGAMPPPPQPPSHSTAGGRKKERLSTTPANAAGPSRSTGFASTATSPQQSCRNNNNNHNNNSDNNRYISAGNKNPGVDVVAEIQHQLETRQTLGNSHSSSSSNTKEREDLQAFMRHNAIGHSGGGAAAIATHDHPNPNSFPDNHPYHHNNPNMHPHHPPPPIVATAGGVPLPSVVVGSGSGGGSANMHAFHHNDPQAYYSQPLAEGTPATAQQRQQHQQQLQQQQQQLTNPAEASLFHQFIAQYMASGEVPGLPFSADNNALGSANASAFHQQLQALYTTWRLSLFQQQQYPHQQQQQQQGGGFGGNDGTAFPPSSTHPQYRNPFDSYNVPANYTGSPQQHTEYSTDGYANTYHYPTTYENASVAPSYPPQSQPQPQQRQQMMPDYATPHAPPQQQQQPYGSSNTDNNNYNTYHSHKSNRGNKRSNNSSGTDPHRRKGSYDNTPQDQKYLQANPFSTYNHNKTILSGKLPDATSSSSATVRDHREVGGSATQPPLQQ